MSTGAAKTPTGFFENLVHAHAQIEERLQELERAADGLTDPARVPAALEAMKGVLEFFATFGVDHNDDEEKTLFPRLKSVPGFAQMLEAFDFQHKMAETEQRALLARVQGFAPGKERGLRELAHRFAEVQRAHILAEERALFPLAEKNLPRRVLVEMSEELRSGRSA
jgi:hemerythrin-like domain-containing protein